jgi:hypothetical protein
MLSEQGEATRGGPTKRGNIGPTSSRKINQTATALGKYRLYDFIRRVTLECHNFILLEANSKGYRNICSRNVCYEPLAQNM